VRRALIAASIAGIASFTFGFETAARADERVASVAQGAPPFVLETPAGSELTLRSFAGRPLVLNVFASWCPPCREELPRIVSAARRSGTRVAFLGVDEQEAEGMATSFAREMRVPYPIAVDHGQFAASYGARSLPETIFVDAHGTVRAIVHGAIPAATLERNLALIAASGSAVKP